MSLRRALQNAGGRQGRQGCSAAGFNVNAPKSRWGGANAEPTHRLSPRMRRGLLPGKRCGSALAGGRPFYG